MDLYMYATGHSQIPSEWHRWCCLSVVASAVADRVYYKKFEWEKLSPNQYIFLVGDSASGKGGALSFAQQFIHPKMNAYTGSVTSKSMIDRMSKPSDDGMPDRSKMLLIQPELADCIGEGPQAQAMVKAMTNWYNPSDRDYEESTRKHGDKILRPPCLNWLAGTTIEWLRETVNINAMRSGFFGRVAVAPGAPTGERVYAPYSPPEYHDVCDVIRQRLMYLTEYTGEFTMTPAARAIDMEWYETRPDPDDEMKPFWRRQHDLNLKIAMTLSLCESMSLKIDEKHILKAQEMTDQSATMLPPIITKATSTQTSYKYDQVSRMIEQFSPIKHSMLLRKVHRWHITADELHKIVAQLNEAGLIEIERTMGGGRKYRWVKQGKFKFGK